MSFLSDLLSFLRFRKKLWLVPIISIVFIFGIMVALAEGPALAPFIYSLF